MTRRQAMAGATAAIAAVFSCSVCAQQPQVFRANADVVIVDVTVLANEVPVTGLAAQDFQVFDNGVPEIPELGATGPIPVDVSLLVDTGAVGGITTMDPMKFWSDIAVINNLLRPGDRVGLTTFSTAVHEEFPLTPVPVDIPSRPRSVGWAVPVDALMQAMLRPGSAARRHLIVEITTGTGFSVSLPERVHEVASRCDALVYVVARPAPGGVVRPALVDAASTTGGGVVRERDIVPAFKTILAALERSYVLTYVPRGVTRTGWHTITVRVAKPGTFTVRARRGYFGG